MTYYFMKDTVGSYCAKHSQHVWHARGPEGMPPGKSLKIARYSEIDSEGISVSTYI